MNKAISIVFGSLFHLPFMAQMIFPSNPGLTVVHKTEVKWSTKPLTWSHFRSVSDTAVIKTVGAKKIKGKAATTTGITANFSCTENILHFEVLAFFSLKQSWYLKEAYGDTAILSHEQLHFNITELYARKIRKLLIEFKNSCGKEKEIRVLVDSLKQAERDENQLYDLESEHSTNKAMQKKWEEKIKKEMEELKLYSNPIGQSAG